ncbi:MAG: HU family DNA-binding protein [Bacteroidaceae bacterium]|nr:HU family DNA-binding protein [Bacteroidaceae bacterium]
MNKAEIAKAVAKGSGLNEENAQKAIDALVACVGSSLESGEKVYVAGLGTFDVKERMARTGINPATNDIVQIPHRRVVRFRVSTSLAKRVR